MSVTELYFLTLLPEIRDSILSLGKVCFILAGIAGFGCVMSLIDGPSKITKSLARYIAGLCIAACCCLMIVPFFPTYERMAIIYSGAWVTQNEEVRQLPDNVVKVMNKFMSNYIEGEDEQ